MTTKNLWNRKTTLKSKLSVFDVVTKQIIFLGIYLCEIIHCTIALSYVYWTKESNNLSRKLSSYSREFYFAQIWHVYIQLCLINILKPQTA